MTHTTYRNRHYRGHSNTDSYHGGENYAYFVLLSDALSTDLPAGTDLEAAIEAIDAALARLESDISVSYATYRLDALIAARGFTADARIMPVFLLDAVISDGALVTDTFLADAVVLAVTIDSHTLDAAILKATASSWLVDAVKLEVVGATVTADARIMPVFTLDAYLQAIGGVTSSFVADAFVRPYFHLDAYVSDGSEPTSQATLGDMTLGDNTLGGGPLLAAGVLSYTADAIVKAAQSGSLSADAIALLASTGSFTADATMMVSQLGSIASDAVVLGSLSGSFSADAAITLDTGGFFTADAVIVTTAENSTLGDMTLGDNALGG